MGKVIRKSLDQIKDMLEKTTAFDGIASGKLSARPYKTYTAMMTQAGTAAPVATIMENGIGTITLARTGAGVYTMTRAGAFTVGKTAVNIMHMGAGKVTATLTNVNTITVNTVDATPAAADGILAGTLVEVRVYN